MVKEETIKKVTAALKAQLLPVDGLREIAVRRPSNDVKLDDLLAVQNESEFIVHAYRQLLGRQPEPEGIENWRRHLDSGTLSRIAFLKHLVDSEEGQARKLRIPELIRTDNSHLVPSGPFWKRNKRSVKVLPTQSFNGAIKEIEGQIQELAQQCLHVVEHIEHRLSKFQTTNSPTMSANPERIVLSAVERPEVLEKLNLLYQRLQSPSNPNASHHLQGVVRTICDLISVQQPTIQHRGWLAIGTDATDIVLACTSQDIPVDCYVTSEACVGFAKHMGVNAIVQPHHGWLPKLVDRSLQVIWAKDQLNTLSDESLLKYTSDLSMALMQKGLLVVEEQARLSAFATLRLATALEISGLELNSDLSNRLTRDSLNPESQLLVFTQPKAHEACE